LKLKLERIDGRVPRSLDVTGSVALVSECYTGVTERRLLTKISLAAPASRQGLTLVHISAQRKRFLWDMGCM